MKALVDSDEMDIEEPNELIPINWHGVEPKDAGKDTPRSSRNRYVPVPKQRFKVYLRGGRDTVNISIKRDLTYEEFLDIWEKVQDLIVERMENE
jgi:hypothetical protein